MLYRFCSGTGFSVGLFIAVTGRTVLRFLLVLHSRLVVGVSMPYCCAALRGTARATRDQRLGEFRSGSTASLLCAYSTESVLTLCATGDSDRTRERHARATIICQRVSCTQGNAVGYFKPIHRAKRPPVILSAAAMPIALGVESTVAVAPTISLVVSPAPSFPTASSAFRPMDDE